MNIEKLKDEIEKSEKMIKFSREYSKYLKKQVKLQEDTNLKDITLNRLHNIRNSINTNGEYLNRIGHEIHCLCVELGLAKKEDWRYGKKETGNMASGFGSQSVYFRKPFNK